MSDNKAPSYPWYPRDFAADEPVQLMSLAEEGAYRRLLDHQWLHGSIPGDLKLIARICKNVSLAEMKKIWPAIEECFTRMPGQPPRLQNRRLERVREERKAYIDKQIESGKRGAAARWRDKHMDGEPIGEPMATPMANECLASAIAFASAEKATTAASPASRSDEPPDPPTTAGQVIATVRRVLWQPDGQPPADWSDGREMSVIKALLERGETADDLIRAVHGLRLLQERGDVDWLRPGKVTLRAVYHTKNGSRDMLTQALDAYAAMPPPEAPRKVGQRAQDAKRADFMLAAERLKRGAA